MTLTARAALTGLLVALIGGPAAAQSIALTWNDCPASASAASDFSGACANMGLEQLLVSFELAEPIDSVIALEATIDVLSSATQLPDWWQYAPAGCRYGKLISSATFLGRTSCTDLWANQGTHDQPPVYELGSPPNGVSQASIHLSIAVPSTSPPRDLVAGTRYYAARLELQNDNGACVDCELPACLVLRNIRLWRLNDGVLESRDLLPTDGITNRATWQGPGASCVNVPTRRHTWGQLKALYR